MSLNLRSDRQKVRHSYKRQFVIGKQDHGNKKLLRVIQPLLSRTHLAAALDRAGHLRDVQHAEIQCRMAQRIAHKGAGHGFRAGQGWFGKPGFFRSAA